MTIINGPPANSASVNSQPSRIAITIPSSTTRLVAANSNTIAEVKSPPLRKTERAIATAAKEQEDEAAPRPQAIPSDRGEASGASGASHSWRPRPARPRRSRSPG
jgi:hypothetical protein